MTDVSGPVPRSMVDEKTEEKLRGPGGSSVAIHVIEGSILSPEQITSINCLICLAAETSAWAICNPARRLRFDLLR